MSKTLQQKSAVEITAPSRLHFGLFSFGRTGHRQFGGVGMMIDQPTVRIRISKAARFQIEGPLAARAADFAKRWASRQPTNDSLSCRIQLLDVPDHHTGLGTGTQLALAIAAGLNAFHRLPSMSPAELAISVGRGLRSAVGTYGFVAGGLIVERGKYPNEEISPLDCRLELPESWRVVLMRPIDQHGLHGAAESAAFRSLPPVPEGITEELLAEVRSHLLPAAAQGDFAAFSESVYRYGRLAGSCFAQVQGGAYNGPRVAELVERTRRCGVQGVGQSSWGPTVFALLPSAAAAESFVAAIRGEFPQHRVRLQISRINNRGTVIRRLVTAAENRV